MHATLIRGEEPSLPTPWAAYAPPCTPPEPCGREELRLIALGAVGGREESEACEKLLAAAARAQGAVELAVGEGLAALAIGDRLIRLGFSNLGDYAREVLGISQRTAQSLARLARELRTRPLLRQAVRAGEVRPRSALTVMPVAVGQAEAAWVERARSDTVRALEAAVRAARSVEEEDDWTRLRVRLAPEDRAVVDEALAVAGKLLPGSSRPQRLEAIAQEYLAEHPVEAGDDGAGAAGESFRAMSRSALARLMAQLEAETDRWSWLPRVPCPAAPEGDFDAMSSAEEIDGAVRALAQLRARWDDLVGWCAHVVHRSGLWRIAGFASFAHYCQERLGLAPRAVEQRASLERRLWTSPALRAARDGGLSYEKIRLLSHLPEHELAAWAERSRSMTCIELRHALEDRDDAQMRAARELRATVPERVALLLAAAFRAVRAVEGRLLDDGRCLVVLARHFLETWSPHVKRARTASQKVRERDLGRCQVPGCSRRAVHGHHVCFRAHGGGDELENQVGLCAYHHLRGIHGGFMRVWGRAPDALVWEVGGVAGWRPDLPPATPFSATRSARPA